MKTIILIDTISRVKDFNRIAQTFVGNVDVVSGKHKVDGKSLLGLYSLDLSKPVEVHYDEEDSERAALLLARYEVSKYEV